MEILILLTLLIALFLFTLVVEHVAKDRAIGEVAEVLCADENYKDFHAAVKKKKEELISKIKENQKRKYN